MHGVYGERKSCRDRQRRRGNLPLPPEIESLVQQIQSPEDGLNELIALLSNQQLFPVIVDVLYGIFYNGRLAGYLISESTLAKFLIIHHAAREIMNFLANTSDLNGIKNYTQISCEDLLKLLFKYNSEELLQLIGSYLSNVDFNYRWVSIRVLAHCYIDDYVQTAFNYLMQGINDEHPRVRVEAWCSASRTNLSAKLSKKQYCTLIETISKEFQQCEDSVLNAISRFIINNISGSLFDLAFCRAEISLFEFTNTELKFDILRKIRLRWKRNIRVDLNATPDEILQTESLIKQQFLLISSWDLRKVFYLGTLLIDYLRRFAPNVPVFDEWWNFLLNSYREAGESATGLLSALVQLRDLYPRELSENLDRDLKEQINWDLVQFTTLDVVPISVLKTIVMFNLELVREQQIKCNLNAIYDLYRSSKKQVKVVLLKYFRQLHEVLLFDLHPVAELIFTDCNTVFWQSGYFSAAASVLRLFIQSAPEALLRDCIPQVCRLQELKPRKAVIINELIDRFGEFLAPLLRHPSLQANREWKIPVETPIRCGLRFDSKFGMEPKNGSDTARMPSRHSKSSVLLRIRTDKLATRWYKKMAKFIQSTTRPFVGINLGQHTLSSQDHKKFLRLLSLNLPNLVYLHLKLSMSDFEDLLPRWAQIIPQLDYLNLLSITVESKIDDDKLAMLLEAISHCRSIYALQLCFDVQGRQIEQILEGLRYSCVAKITLPNLLRYCEFNRLSSYASRIFGKRVNQKNARSVIN